MFTHAWCAENTFKVSISSLIYLHVLFAGTLVSFDGCGNLAARFFLVFVSIMEHFFVIKMLKTRSSARRLSTLPILCRLSKI